MRFKTLASSVDSRLGVIRSRPTLCALRPLPRTCIWRQLAAGWPIDAVAQHIVGLHQLVNLTGAFIDHRALAVAIEPAGRIFVRIAIGTMDLHAVAGRSLRSNGREPFRESCLARVAPSDVLQPSRPQPEQARRLIVGLHLRDHFLDELVLRDLDAKRLAVARVLAAGIAAGPN